METIDYQMLFIQLRELLPALRSGEIYAIIYGSPEDDVRVTWAHRIRVINTPAGEQFAIHKYHVGCGWGSGEYLGTPDDNEEIIRRAQWWIQYHHKPLSNVKAQAWLEARRGQSSWAPPQYFSIQEE